MEQGKKAGTKREEEWKMNIWYIQFSDLVEMVQGFCEFRPSALSSSKIDERLRFRMAQRAPSPSFFRSIAAISCPVRGKKNNVWVCFLLQPPTRGELAMKQRPEDSTTAIWTWWNWKKKKILQLSSTRVAVRWCIYWSAVGTFYRQFSFELNHYCNWITAANRAEPFRPWPCATSGIISWLLMKWFVANTPHAQYRAVMLAFSTRILNYNIT